MIFMFHETFYTLMYTLIYIDIHVYILPVRCVDQTSVEKASRVLLSIGDKMKIIIVA